MIRNVYLKFVFAVGFLTLLNPFPIAAQQVQSQTEAHNRPELVIQTGHTSLVNSVAFSPDGKNLASGGGDNALRVWDIETGRQIKSLVGHTSYILSVTYSADGRLLASGGFDNTVRLWDAKTGALLRTLEGHTGGIFSVAFARDGKMLASGGFDKSLKLWDVALGKEIKSLVGHTDVIFSVEFSPDGKSIASSSLDNSIKLWDVSTGRHKTLTGHTKGAWSVSFSHDGKTLASSGPDGTIRLWEVASGNQIKSLEAQTSVLYSVVISPDGKTVASAGDNNTVKLWDIATGVEIKSFKGHTSYVKSIAFSKDGQTLVSGSSDNTIRLWDVSTGTQIKPLLSRTSHVLAVSVSPNAKRFATVTFTNEIKLWNLETGLQIESLEYGAQGVNHINSIVFSPDSKTLASGHRDDTIRLWDVETGQLRKAIRPGISTAGSSESTGSSLSGKWNMVVTAQGNSIPVNLELLQTGEAFNGTFSSHAGGGTIPTGKVIGNRISGIVKIDAQGQNIELKLEANTDNGELNGRLTGIGLPQISFRATRTHGIYSVAYSPDGKILASGSDDNTIKLWDVETGRPLRSLEGHMQGVTTVAFSPDGKTLASGSKDKSVNLWEVNTGLRIKSLAGHTAEISTVLFSPDGGTVASTGFDKTIRLWNVVSGDSKSLTGHLGKISSIAYSSDGKMLASGGDDRTIRIWDVAGVTSKTFEGHPKEISGVTFIPGRKLLFSSSWDGTVKVWDTETNRSLATLISLDKNDWVIIDLEGGFDASAGAQELMHFVVGSEPINLEQIKDRYYEPGLLFKLMNRQPLRKIVPFTGDELYPEISYEPLKAGQKSLTIHLRNRGGGIGPVQIFVNDKIFVDDARPNHFNPAQKEASFTIDLSRAAFVPGLENKIEIFARNGAGWLRSRGSEIYSPAEGKKSEAPPELYAIISGVADYPENTLDLQFSSKDAEDFARVLEIGATKVFGKDKVHIRLLSSDAQNQSILTGTDSKQLAATKDNFKRVFEEFRKAKATDILVVYLSGHGTSIKLDGDTGDTYLYLTQDALTTDQTRLLDEKLRRETAISSLELVQWVKDIKAKKQAMILDTCAAGAAENNLITKKEITTEQTYQIRAIDRLKTLTGFYVLMGSAANAQSYEATQYRQGLLTYALLQGMKGAGLENEYAYVDKVFKHAVKTVPDLARGNGKIQEPRVFMPEQSQDFFVGRFTEEEQKLFTLKRVKPVILRPNLQNDIVPNDTLRLTPLLMKALTNASTVTSGGRDEAPFVFVDAAEMYDAILPGGRYRIEGDVVKLSIFLFKNNESQTKPIEITGNTLDKDSLIQAIVKAITEAAKKL